jgi:hypothetical protein
MVMFGAMLFGGFFAGADDIYDDLLDRPGAVAKWQNSEIMTFLPNGGPEFDDSAVKITSVDATKGAMAQFSVGLRWVRGKTVTLSAKVKGENISALEKATGGIKLTIRITGADDKVTELNPQPKLGGTFNWRKCITLATIPNDAKSVTLVIGLEGVTGTVYFSDLELDNVD